jgi:exonuclease III
MDGLHTQNKLGTFIMNRKQVRCIEINLQHSRSATDNLMKKMDDEEPDLILIQEPYEYRNRITGVDKKYRILFTAGTGKHRAAIIIINSTIDAILITKLSDEDTVLVEIIHEKWKFFAASMYFDLEDQIENNFTKKDELMRFVKGGRILIAVNSNSRSKTWHDSKTNSGGRKMEESLVSKDLHITNEESERPTFFNSRGSSNIDLTIANNNLIAEVKEWEISNEDSLSDHNYIQYKISKGGDCNQNNSNTARV